MSKQIIEKHPAGHAYGASLSASDKTTSSGVPHRVLSENGNRDIFIDFTMNAKRFPAAIICENALIWA
jgi:hypothetical protein